MEPVRLLAARPSRRAEIAAQLDQFGYQSVWLGVPVGYFDLPSDLLSGTTRLTVATGVLGV